MTHQPLKIAAFVCFCFFCAGCFFLNIQHFIYILFTINKMKIIWGSYRNPFSIYTGVNIKWMHYSLGDAASVKEIFIGY